MLALIAVWISSPILGWRKEDDRKRIQVNMGQSPASGKDGQEKGTQKLENWKNTTHSK